MARTSPRRARAFRLAVWAILIVVLSAVLLDPLPLLSDIVSVTRIRWELPRAIRRWDSAGSPSYRIHVKGSIPLACFIDGELSVRDGRLVGVSMRQDPFSPDSPLLAVDQGQWQQPGCPYEDLTVERMFERVEGGLVGLGAFGAPLTVRFHQEQGFITEYRFGRSSRGGAFGYVVSECCTWFEFDSFTVLAP